MMGLTFYDKLRHATNDGSNGGTIESTGEREQKTRRAASSQMVPQPASRSHGYLLFTTGELDLKLIN